MAPPVEVGVVYDGILDYPVNADGRATYQDSLFRTWALGDITADPTNPKHLALVWSDMRNNPYPGAFLPVGADGFADPYAVTTNSDIIVSQSLDSGKTWSPALALQIPRDQFQPWGEFDKNGNLQIGYFDRYYDPANHEYGYTLATVGMTASKAWVFHTQELSTALSDPTQGDRWSATTVNPNYPNATLFLGDYSNIAVTANGVAGYWTDMREDVTFLSATGHGQDAYFAFIPSLPVLSPSDLAMHSALLEFDLWQASQKKQ
jgi:hypothetical protein